MGPVVGIDRYTVKTQDIIYIRGFSWKGSYDKISKVLLTHISSKELKQEISHLLHPSPEACIRTSTEFKRQRSAFVRAANGLRTDYLSRKRGTFQ